MWYGKMNEQILNLRFVAEVEKYPLLYDNNSPQYSRKDLTEKAWYAVGKEVNLTVAESKEKWKNLRAVFSRHMKPLPPGCEAKKRKPYYLAEAMQFVLPYIKSLTSTQQNSLSNVKQEVVIDESGVQEESYQQQDPLELQVEERLFCNETDHQSPSKTTLISSQKKRSIEDDDDNFGEYSNTKRTATSDDLSHKRMFLLSLLPELEELDHQQIKIFKRRVLQLIDEIVKPSSSTTSTISSVQS